VIVVGRWNRAILTPLWIGQKLLGVEEGQEIQLQVPMDGSGPYRVSHAGLAVMADQNRLQIDVERNNFAELERAIIAVRKAMEELPLTPVAAAGINTYQACEGDQETACIGRMWTSELDDQLQSSGLSITDRMALRRLAWKGGHITLRIAQWTLDTEECHYGCWYNFERRCTVMSDLNDWLQTPISDIEDVVRRVKQILVEEVAA
jgi:hypothetical protein